MMHSGAQESVMSYLGQIIGKSSRKAVSNVEVAIPALISKRIVLGTVVYAVRPSVGAQHC
jgi:hypothetical protein